MRIGTANRNSATQRLLDLAHDCLSGVLQFDYLSNGAGHRQSTAVKPRKTSNARRPAASKRGRSSPRRFDTNAGPATSERTETEDLPGEAAAAAGTPDIVRRYLSEIATRGRLSSTEEYRLARAACDGDPSARRRLIEHQLGLVVMMARPYRNRGLPLLDLLEEGNIGLMLAIEKFDPERGCRFSTYAKWWIRQSIELALMTQSRVVHVPVYVTRALKRRSKASAPKTMTAALQPDAEAQRDASKLLLFDVGNRLETLSAEVAGQPELLLDSLAAAEHEQPDLRLHLADQRQRLQTAMEMLNEREKLVIQLRFGLADDTTLTLESIATRLKLSSERVRQIQSEALAKLRGALAARSGFGPSDLL